MLESKLRNGREIFHWRKFFAFIPDASAAMAATIMKMRVNISWSRLSPMPIISLLVAIGLRLQQEDLCYQCTWQVTGHNSRAHDGGHKTRSQSSTHHTQFWTFWKRMLSFCTFGPWNYFFGIFWGKFSGIIRCRFHHQSPAFQLFRFHFPRDPYDNVVHTTFGITTNT